jgi:hypothetical protein
VQDELAEGKKKHSIDDVINLLLVLHKSNCVMCRGCSGWGYYPGEVSGGAKAEDVRLYRCSECWKSADKEEDIQHGKRWVDAPPGYVAPQAEWKANGNTMSLPIIPRDKIQVDCGGGFAIERNPYKNDDGTERADDDPELVAYLERTYRNQKVQDSPFVKAFFLTGWFAVSYIIAYFLEQFFPNLSKP